MTKMRGKQKISLSRKEGTYTFVSLLHVNNNATWDAKWNLFMILSASIIQLCIHWFIFNLFSNNKLKNISVITKKKTQSYLFKVFWGSNKISCFIADQKRRRRSKYWVWIVAVRNEEFLHCGEELKASFLGTTVQRSKGLYHRLDGWAVAGDMFCSLCSISVAEIPRLVFLT